MYHLGKAAAIDRVEHVHLLVESQSGGAHSASQFWSDPCTTRRIAFAIESTGVAQSTTFTHLAGGRNEAVCSEGDSKEIPSTSNFVPSAKGPGAAAMGGHSGKGSFDDDAGGVS